MSHDSSTTANARHSKHFCGESMDEPGEDFVTYPTGARGSKDAEGYRYDLISPIAMERLAKVCHEGAVKHGDRNWEQGIVASKCICRAIRHLYKHLRGDKSEDHLGHALWRIHAAIHSLEAWPELNAGTLRGPGCTPPPIN